MTAAALSLLVLAAALQADVPGRMRAVPAGPERGAGLRPVVQESDPLPGDEELRSRTISAEAEAALVDLGAPEFARRQAASELLRGDSIPIDELLGALARTTLSDEQRHRLVAIAIDRIVNAPRGALGIRMDVARNPGLVPGLDGGVRVTGLVEGMPAARHLQVDDVIVAINGRALRDRDDLVTVVQGLAPGTTVRVEAIRAERDERGKPRLDAAGLPVTRRVDTAFPLGSTRDLEQDGDRQGAMVANPVTGQRLELARAVAQRFGPVPRIVAVPEDRLAAARLAEQSPDIHPDVQSLLRWRELVKLQGGMWDETTLELLRGTLAELRRRAADPSLTTAERNWFGRVADRYAELIPSGDEP